MKTKAIVRWPITIFVLVLAVASGFAVWAIEKPKYTLNETQELRLKVIYGEAVSVKVQFDKASNDLQAKLKEYTEACEKIKQENHLPAAASCDINHPGTVSPPAPATSPSPDNSKKK